MSEGQCSRRTGKQKVKEVAALKIIITTLVIVIIIIIIIIIVVIVIVGCFRNISDKREKVGKEEEGKRGRRRVRVGIEGE